MLVYHVWKLGAPDGQPMDLVGVRSVAPHLWNGVTLFFVLSGFLLFRPFVSAVTRGSPLPKFRRYFANRALRILPAYWVILLVVGLVLDAALLRGPQGRYYEGGMNAGELLLSAAFLQNYSEQTLYTGIAPAWSLAVEVVWYLLLPLLALVAAGAAVRARTAAGRTRAVLLPVALMIALAMSGKAAALLVIDWSTGVERSLWGTADFFAYGMVVAVVGVELEEGRLQLPSWWRRAAAGALVALILLAVVFGVSNLDPGNVRNYAYNVAMALACALLLALVVLPDERTSRRPPLVRVLDSRVLTAIGVASYSLFLWHEPIAWWLRNQGLTAERMAGTCLQSRHRRRGERRVGGADLSGNRTPCPAAAP